MPQEEVPENVQEAREWIRAWRARSAHARTCLHMFVVLLHPHIERDTFRAPGPGDHCNVTHDAHLKGSPFSHLLRWLCLGVGKFLFLIGPILPDVYSSID